ncbi:DUF2784 domain-containing protein [candidate division KSB1 bacterium]|nr:DUF2784 domain-containing protein [candidate division KSB1 bacterium]NIR69416.1 DUF2784 domain-containing protein [candidate division KSB1 bacterium]NIS24214.1 DUF2784 domain-containing protein [candidate division KSB1 bacterium]NIT71128.1 DUF2784 domain-containing protein [candidate division KSB1 bacterium]NIU24833.1 DUF2784 domain-containing protein [candidate division KSB1 bacterium]
MYQFLADVVVVLHFAFVVFAILGGLLVLKWRKAVFLHVPAVVWAALVEFAGWMCPLTPLENWLRMQGGGSAYRGDFVQRYILPVLYPSGLTREIQVVLGLLVIAVNVLVYWYVFVAKRKARTFS